MAKQDNKDQFVAVSSMFVSGNVRRMRDIETLYPTAIAKSLKMNHSRYIEKLYKPEEFSMKQLGALANLLEINIQLILDVVIRQMAPILKVPKRK
jgi:hypothetical protein